MTTAPKRILVFPGTTLVGLEILNSLRHLPGFEIYGAGIDIQAGLTAGYAKYDHVPHLSHESFEAEILSVVDRNSVDYVYPANDLAISALSRVEFPGATVVSHPSMTVRTANSKIATHSLFSRDRITPKRFVSGSDDLLFPVFSKPDVGHSSIDATILRDQAALSELMSSTESFWETHLVTELLIGDEVTVDCFSTTAQGLLFAAPRTRDLAKDGVSIVTTDYEDEELDDMARLIASRLVFNGPWFFQAKRDAAGSFRLMEIGARLAGASGIRRAQGVNLAQLAILATDQAPISIYKTRFRFVSRRIGGVPVVQSREQFSALYVDLDDTLILNGLVNKDVRDLIVQVNGLGLYTALITRHRVAPQVTLRKFSLEGLFDDVFHVANGDPKPSYIRDDCNVIFIDDSFSERVSCASKRNVLAVDASSANQLGRLFDGNR